MAIFYADALAARGHDVTVVCEASAEPPLRRRLRRLRAHLVRGGAPASLPQWRPKLAGLLTARKAGEGIVAELPDADVLVATWWATAEAVRSAPTSKGRKIYFVQDHEVFPYFPFARTSATYKLPFHKIVVSEWLRQAMAAFHGDEDVSLVPNPVSEPFLQGGARARSDGFVVGTVYSDGPRKNSEMALQAVRLARLRLPEIGFIGFGAYEAPPSMPRDARSSYTRLPPQRQIPSLYAACDAWLSPSISEGFGLPILEAMATGTPVIATRAGAAPELVTDRTGILVETNAEAMAAAIIRLSSTSGAAWREMSDACRATAAAYHEAASVNAFEAALMKAGR